MVHSSPARRSVLWRFATRWDGIVLARAAGVTLLALALAWLIAAASDEGGISWSERAGHALPFAPFCGAIGVWAALAPVRVRGEAAALEALGRTRGQVGAPAVTGAVITAVACAVAIGLAPAVDIAGFYPTATHASAWRFRDGRFEDPARGLRIREDGAPEKFGTAAADPIQAWAVPRHGRAAASLATAFASLAMGLIAARMLLAPPAQPLRKARIWRDGLVDAAACGAAIISSAVLFQVAAAGRAPALSAAAPMVILLGFSVKRYRALS
jgi:hypothetical protein